MVARVGSIAIELTSNAFQFSGQFRSAADLVDRQSRRMRDSLSLVDRGALSFATSLKGIVGATAGLVSFNAVLARTQRAIADLDRIGKTSRSSGLSAEFYQTLTFAAESASIGLDKINAALLRSNRVFGEANAGYGELVEKLKRLNPELLSLVQNADSNEERIRILADAIEQAGDATAKAALASAVFGEGGSEFVRFLENGADGLDRMAVRARELGAIISNETIAKAEEAADTIGLLSKAIDLQLSAAFAELAPAITFALEEFNIFIRDVKAGIEELRAINGTFFDVFGNLAGNTAQQKITDFENAVAQYRDALAEQRTVTDLAKRGLADDTDLANARAEVQATGEAVERLSDTAARARIFMEQFTGSLKANTEAARETAAVQKQLSAGVQNAFDAFVKAGDQAFFTSQERALAALNETYDDLLESIRAAGLAADDEREAVERLTDAYLKQRTAALGLADAKAKLGAGGFVTEVIKGVRVTRPASSLDSGGIPATAHSINVQDYLRSRDDLAGAGVAGGGGYSVNVQDFLRLRNSLPSAAPSGSAGSSDLPGGSAFDDLSFERGVAHGVSGVEDGIDRVGGAVTFGTDNISAGLDVLRREYGASSNQIVDISNRILEQLKSQQSAARRAASDTSSRDSAQFSFESDVAKDVRAASESLRNDLKFSDSDTSLSSLGSFDAIQFGTSHNVLPLHRQARVVGGADVESEYSRAIRNLEKQSIFGTNDQYDNALEKVKREEEKYAKMFEGMGREFDRLYTPSEPSGLSAADFKAIEPARLSGGATVNITVNGFTGDRQSARELAAEIGQQARIGVARA